MHGPKRMDLRCQRSRLPVAMSLPPISPQPVSVTTCWLPGNVWKPRNVCTQGAASGFPGYTFKPQNQLRAYFLSLLTETLLTLLEDRNLKTHSPVLRNEWADCQINSASKLRRSAMTDGSQQMSLSTFSPPPSIQKELLMLCLPESGWEWKSKLYRASRKSILDVFKSERGRGQQNS